MADLEERLKETQDVRFRLIATDGVFSMQGDLAPLEEICDLADKYDALVMVDDSHATAFVGPSGRGTPEEMGVIDRVDVVTSTLGKALGGASGGFTTGKKEIVAVLRQRSRPYLFSNTLAPPIVAGALKALEVAQSRPELRGRLWGEHRILPQTNDRAGIRHHSGDTSHRAHHGQGRAQERHHGGVDEQARHLCRQFQLPGRAEGRGPYQGADIGGPHEGNSWTQSSPPSRSPAESRDSYSSCPQ